MEICEFQNIIWKTYGHHDEKRGLTMTFKWFRTEIDELWEAIQKRNKDDVREEMADVFAWLISIANLLNINLEEVSIEKYGSGCPKCMSIPCRCRYRERPGI